MGVAANIAKRKMADGDFDWTALTVKALLLDDTHTVDPDDDFVADLTGELSGTGYVRKTLASLAVTTDDPNNRAVMDAADLSWTGADFGTPETLVLFAQVTNDADSWIIGYSTVRDVSNNPITTDGSTLTLPFSATFGVAYIS